MKQTVLMFGAWLAIFAWTPLTGWAQETAENLTVKALYECHRGRSAKTRHVRLAHFERGQVLAEQAVKLNDHLADAHFALFCTLGEQIRLDGEFLNSVWGYERMMVALDRTLELNPNHLDALSSKGTFLIKLPRLFGGDSARGEEMLQRVIKEDPTSINARLTLAKVYADRGEVERGLVLAKRALKFAKLNHRQDLIPEAQATLSELQAISTQHEP